MNSKLKTEKDTRSCEYTTENEISYLNGLVTGQHFMGMTKDHVCTVSKERLLRNYIKSAERRQKWNTFGGVDPKQVIAEAEALLQKVLV